jgi:hypothetical protein
MKIKVYISKEFDTEEWWENDPEYPDHIDPEIEAEHAVNLLVEDIEYLVRHDQLKSHIEYEIVT